MAVTHITWHATVLTLFPGDARGRLGVSPRRQGAGTRLWALEARDIRAPATDRHRSVDDTPPAGGLGMVLRADAAPAAAIDGYSARTAQDRPQPADEPARVDH